MKLDLTHSGLSTAIAVWRREGEWRWWRHA
jgi:hypothetical protein